MYKVTFSKTVKFKGKYVDAGLAADATEQELNQLQEQGVVAHAEEAEKPKRQAKTSVKEGE